MDGLLEYVDKQKMPEWLSKRRYNSDDVRNQFRHAPKLVKEFDNPKLLEGEEGTSKVGRTIQKETVA